MAKKKARKKKAKPRKPARRTTSSAVMKSKKARAERKLDEGLQESFPASDPPAQTDPTRSIRE
jgi:hypothetical protein